MDIDDSMDLSSPPRTPKPVLRSLRPSTPYKSNATVISLDSTPEPCDNINNNNYDAEHHLTADFLEFEPDNNNDDFPPDFTSPTQHRETKIPPLKLSRPRTYIPEPSGKMQYASEVLDHISSSLPTASNPPAISIILLLTPNPARLTVVNDLEDFATRFSADFSSATYEGKQRWHSINLYEHFHGWAARNPLSDGNGIARATGFDDNMEDVAGVDDVGIGSIHPYALHAKLAQEKEVNWRLALPVLQSLVDRQVKKGARRFVVCGLKVGDVEGVRGFARQVCLLCILSLGRRRKSPSYSFVRDHTNVDSDCGAEWDICFFACACGEVDCCGHDGVYEQVGDGKF
jgi:hypothetical protein